MIGNPSFRQYRAARAHFGWSQAEAAKRAGLSVSTMCRIEKPNNHFTLEVYYAAKAAYEVENLLFTIYDGIAKRP